MKIGSIKENLDLEQRIAVTPEIIKKYKSLDLNIILPKGYGEHLGISDKEFTDEGAEILDNNEKVLLQCISELKSYFNIDKWQINQPIIISEVYNLLGNVLGVQSVESVSFNNVSGTNVGYSQYRYDFTQATRGGVIYPSLDPSIFELKYPDSDIKGRVITY